MEVVDFETPFVHNWLPHDVAEIVIGGEAQALLHKRREVIDNMGVSNSLEYFDAVMANFWK